MPISRLAEAVTETRADIDASSLEGPMLGHVGEEADDFYAVAANDERYVAVTKEGRVHWSTNGVEWEFGFDAGDKLRDVAWGPTPGVFVAVGVGGHRVKTSNGAAAEAEAFTEEDVHLSQVIWDGAKFLTYGDGAVWWSEWGVTWTEVALADDTRVEVVDHADGRFYGAVGNVIHVSEDGFVWTPAYTMPEAVTALATRR